MSVEALASELRRAGKVRTEALTSRLEQLQGELGTSKPALSGALRLAQFFPTAFDSVVEDQWQRSASPGARVLFMRPVLKHLNMVTDFVEGWLSTSTQADPPRSLISAVEREATHMSLPDRNAVVAIGGSGNFITVVADIEHYWFDPLGPRCPPRPAELAGKKYAVIKVPRPEGVQVFWRPVTLGHEVAHLAVEEFQTVASLNLDSRFDIQEAKKLYASDPDIPEPLELLETAKNWTRELLCDAYALSRFGPVSITSLGEFLSVVGATDMTSLTHPPGWFRLQLLLGWLAGGRVGYADALLEAWDEEAVRPQVVRDWVAFLAGFLTGLSDDIMNAVQSWGAPAYDTPTRLEGVDRAVAQLTEGVLPLPEDLEEAARDESIDADLMAAAWIVRIDGRHTQANALTEKALDDLEFLRRWQLHGGALVEPPRQAPDDLPDHAVLSESSLRQRLSADAGDGRLQIQPLLPGAVSRSAIDLRLGNKFVVFVRSISSSFDPLDTEGDPRMLQRGLELDWGETFVLHPGEMVLAATLEYIVMPSDLTAQVITRSSYGRLGLLSATAVQVHPNYKGCLTLELVNLGTLPLVLTPGERLAQLILSTTAPVPATGDGKYQLNTGPQFSRVVLDQEVAVLRRLRGDS